MCVCVCVCVSVAIHLVMLSLLVLCPGLGGLQQTSQAGGGLGGGLGLFKPPQTSLGQTGALGTNFSKSL